VWPDLDKHECGRSRTIDDEMWRADYMLDPWFPNCTTFFHGTGSGVSTKLPLLLREVPLDVNKLNVLRQVQHYVMSL